MVAYGTRYLATATTLLLATAAAAAPADIERCARMPSDEARIDCLEDAVRRLSGAPAGPPAAAHERATAPPRPAAAAVPAATPGVPATVAPAPGPPPPEANAASKLDTLGAEQVARRREKDDDGEAERLAAEVVDFEFVGRNKLKVTLENGQVWVQNRSDRPNLYPRLRNLEGFPVEMWRTSQGSYRMYVPEANRIIRIERLR